MPLKLLTHSLWKQQVGILWWCLRKVPMLFWVKPKVLELTPQCCRLQVPLNWRTKNHVGSMYFGALLSAADLVCGLLVLGVMEEQQLPCRLLFKEVHGKFLRRPEDKVEFCCVRNTSLEKTFLSLQSSGGKAFADLKVQAFSQGELVAEFELEVALKRL
ncbi:MAG: DUF4442 domain-containing protein [Oligoflexales bacterium]